MDSARGSAGSVLGRHETYTLRRALIGSLQVTTRGIPRTERFTTQRAFAEAWRELSGRGDLGILAEMLHLGSSTEARRIPPILCRLAEGLGAKEHLPAGASAYGSQGSEDPDWAAMERGSKQVAERRAARNVEVDGQGDLFPIGLVAQPL